MKERWAEQDMVEVCRVVERVLGEEGWGRSLVVRSSRECRLQNVRAAFADKSRGFRCVYLGRLKDIQ